MWTVHPKVSTVLQVAPGNSEQPYILLLCRTAGREFSFACLDIYRFSYINAARKFSKMRIQ